MTCNSTNGTDDGNCMGDSSDDGAFNDTNTGGDEVYCVEYDANSSALNESGNVTWCNDTDLYGSQDGFDDNSTDNGTNCTDGGNWTCNGSIDGNSTDDNGTEWDDGNSTDLNGTDANGTWFNETGNATDDNVTGDGNATEWDNGDDNSTSYETGNVTDAGNSTTANETDVNGTANITNATDNDTNGNETTANETGSSNETESSAPLSETQRNFLNKTAQKEAEDRRRAKEASKFLDKIGIGQKLRETKNKWDNAVCDQLCQKVHGERNVVDKQCPKSCMDKHPQWRHFKPRSSRRTYADTMRELGMM